MALYDKGKVIPDRSTLSSNLEQTVRKRVEQEVMKKILRESGYEEQVRLRMKTLSPVLDDYKESLAAEVFNVLEKHREQCWRDVVSEMGNRIEL